MTPLPEFSEPRRSFVKKSLATTVGISFAGLIRAHGEGTTGTTAPDTTIGTEPATTEATTVPDTTIGTEPETTYETTVPDTTIGEEETTAVTTAPPTPKNYKMRCSFPVQPGQPFVYNGGDADPVGWVNEGTDEAPWWRRVWVRVEIESNKTNDAGWYSESGVVFTCKGCWTLGPGMVVQDPFGSAPATGWTNWAEIKREVTITCDPTNGKMTRSRTPSDMVQQQADTQNDGSKLDTAMAGGEGGTQTVTVKYKAPYGDFGDAEEASVIWVSEDRAGK